MWKWSADQLHLQNKKIWDLLIEPLSAGFNVRLSDCAEVSSITVIGLQDRFGIQRDIKRRVDLIKDSEIMFMHKSTEVQ